MIDKSKKRDVNELDLHESLLMFVNIWPNDIEHQEYLNQIDRYVAFLQMPNVKMPEYNLKEITYSIKIR